MIGQSGSDYWGFELVPFLPRSEFQHFSGHSTNEQNNIMNNAQYLDLSDKLPILNDDI